MSEYKFIHEHQGNFANAVSELLATGKWILYGSPLAVLDTCEDGEKRMHYCQALVSVKETVEELKAK